MPQPHLRAADADRAAVADALGSHMSAGRLTVAEFDERVARAYAAKTYGELAELTADLPAAPNRALRPQTQPDDGASRPAHHRGGWPAPGACGAMTGGWTGGWAGSRSGGWDGEHPWRAWLSTGLVVLTIWTATSLASGELLYFWPIWVIGPWGLMLLLHTVAEGATAGRRIRRPSLPHGDVPAGTGLRSQSEGTSPWRQ